MTFYRPHGERSAMRTSVAQAFAENGDAFVLRGNPFEWKGKWPHLPPAKQPDSSRPSSTGTPRP